MSNPIFDNKEEVINEMIIMFDADIEDLVEGELRDLSKEEMVAVYELMVISYKLGTEEV